MKNVKTEKGGERRNLGNGSSETFANQTVI